MQEDLHVMIEFNVVYTSTRDENVESVQQGSQQVDEVCVGRTRLHCPKAPLQTNLLRHSAKTFARSSPIWLGDESDLLGHPIVPPTCGIFCKGSRAAQLEYRISSVSQAERSIYDTLPSNVLLPSTQTMGCALACLIYRHLLLNRMQQTVQGVAMVLHE
eukprot:scaffold1628_cov407-Prasinococcus_capsulatus_cf.AAC.28